MKTVCEFNECNGCSACVDLCPRNCIAINDSIKTLNAVKDLNRCINCGICDGVCPKKNPAASNEPLLIKQGWANDSSRNLGSSGGIASSIVKNFISNGGYVASCLFRDGDFVFDITNDISVATKFSGSKYVKSNPLGIYKKIKSVIKNNKVLFIGLPCQVAGIKNAFQREDNLYTIDLICHGTPSIKILDKYLDEKGFELRSLNDISFRNKTHMCLILDGKPIYSNIVADEYICGFLSSLFYSENCYKCDYARLSRVSDITLGDSWGTDLKEEEKNGVSLILIQSQKGNELLNFNDVTLVDVNSSTAISHNHQLSKASLKHKNTNKFFNEIIANKKITKSITRSIPKVILRQRLKYFLIRLGLK